MGRKRQRMLLGAAVVTGALGAATMVAAESKVQGAGPLQDLRTNDDGVEHAAAHVKAEQTSASSTEVQLKVSGLAHLQAGRIYGAHVHVGPCVEGDGLAAGAHYNHAGGAVISDETEVWLDFTVNESGQGGAIAVVPFLIPPGAAKSVVVHELATTPGTGSAGPRVACLPVEF